jgi:transcriptional regulator with XRE-family HTH domain
MTAVAQANQSVGTLLRQWRERRRMSQLDLAIQAEVSARHLSFVETGRSKPSSDMILRLTDHLDVPLRGAESPFARWWLCPGVLRASAGLTTNGCSTNGHPAGAYRS